MEKQTADMANPLEEGNETTLDFSKLRDYFAKDGTEKNIMPAVVQHATTKEVLMLAYANAQALRLTRVKGVAVFWSTTRDSLWVKGETSGCLLGVIEVRVNCEQNSLLYLVEPKSKIGACHVKSGLLGKI